MTRPLLPALLYTTASATAALLMLSGPAEASNFTGQPAPMSAMPGPIQRPPAAYRLGAVLSLHTMPSYAVADVCHALGSVPFDLACELNGVAYMPNPCEFRGDRYAELLCHEIGHREGWSGNHPSEDSTR